MMPEESGTPDSAELARLFIAAAGRRDLDAVMTFYRPDAVWDLSDADMETCVGTAAIRDLWEVWFGAYEELTITSERVLDLGSGVVCVGYEEDGRLLDSHAHVKQQRAQVIVLIGGSISRMSAYMDFEHARAAAVRLAGELR